MITLSKSLLYFKPYTNCFLWHSMRLVKIWLLHLTQFQKLDYRGGNYPSLHKQTVRSSIKVGLSPILIPPSRSRLNSTVDREHKRGWIWLWYHIWYDSWPNSTPKLARRWDCSNPHKQTSIHSPTNVRLSPTLPRLI